MAEPKGESFLLDTSALLAHFRQEEGYQRVHGLLQEKSAEIFICALSIAEFARRLRELGAPQEEAKDAALAYADLADRVLSVDTATAIRAFELSTTASARIPLADSLIAAAAQISDAILIHRDAHFSAIPSLRQSPLA